MRKDRPLFVTASALVLAALSLTVLPTVAAAQSPYIGQWGTFGNANGQFNNPLGVATNASGDVYVVDSFNHRVQKFSSTGAFITKWGAFGASNGAFKFPQGVAVDASGNVYVADVSNNRIQKFNGNGGFITKWGTLGSGNGQFNSPTGVAVDASGDVYVTDSGNSRVQKFSSAGAFITKWGTPGPGTGSFVSPQGIAVDLVGDVYVADTGNHRIQKFAGNGTFITKWGSIGNGNGLFDDPSAVAVDGNGVYVTDRDNHRVQMFGPGGSFIAKWGVAGNGDGEFAYPRGVSSSPSGKIYVVDSNNRRVQIFFNEDPNCDGAVALHEVVWPPNHELVPVTISGVTDPDGNPLTIEVTSITQDEPLNTIGDGNTCPDAMVDEAGVPHVRWERSGTPAVPGNGRVYRISFTASDPFGGSCDGAVTVCVPHDQDTAPVCADDGPLYNSLARCEPGSRKDFPETALTTALAVRTVGRGVVLEYSLAEDADVNLSVFDLAGRRVATIENARKGAGNHSVTWESGLTRGMYFYRLQAGSAVVTKTVLHAR